MGWGLTIINVSFFASVAMARIQDAEAILLFKQQVQPRHPYDQEMALRHARVLHHLPQSVFPAPEPVVGLVPPLGFLQLTPHGLQLGSRMGGVDENLVLSPTADGSSMGVYDELGPGQVIIPSQ